MMKNIVFVSILSTLGTLFLFSLLIFYLVFNIRKYLFRIALTLDSINKKCEHLLHYTLIRSQIQLIQMQLSGLSKGLKNLFKYNVN